MATVNGSTGDDSITGTEGDDSLTGNSGRDTIRGGGGNDTISGNADSDSLEGGEGADSIDGGTGADTVSGGGGNDRIEGDDGSDFIDGGQGDDTIFGDSEFNNTHTGNDTISGGAGNDSISGNGGNDDIDGGAGRDTLSGGDGDDFIDGWTGDDSIDGGDGDDFIYGYDGADTIDGGAGNDTIEGEADNDSIRGGSGNDELLGGGGSDTMEGGTGFDSMMGGTGDDSLSGGDDSDTVVGEEGNDTLHGDGGDDTVSGHEGDDALHGGAGDDSLYGGSGDDYFDGGTGSDLYFMDRNAGGGTNDPGETDRDVVRFEPGMGNDTAFGFHGEEDYIYIGAVPEADVLATQLDADTWRLTFTGNTSDSLTLNFASGTAPDSEGDLRNQFATQAEYTPPENGAQSTFAVACLTPSARVLTPSGLRRIGDLKAGDRVVTADHGAQKLLAVSRTKITAAEMGARVGLRPIVIAAGALGGGLPERKMHVSRQHGFTVLGGQALVRAAHLADPLKLARVQANRPNAITYVHLLLARHALLQVEGLWTESYYYAAAPENDGAADVPPAFAGFAAHAHRCRPLLRRTDLRRCTIDPSSIGRITTQSRPKTCPAFDTASAPAGLRP